MNTTAVYPVRGGYMVIAYENHAGRWRVIVESMDEAIRVARRWRWDGIKPEGAKL